MDDLDSPRNGHHQIAKVPDEVHQREDQDREELGLPGSLIVTMVLFGKLPFLVFFLIESPDNRVSGVGLFNLAVDLPQLSLLSAEEPLGSRGHKGDHCQTQRNREQGHQGQFPTDRDHQDQYPDEGDHTGNDLDETLLEGSGNVIHIIDHPAHYIPIAVGIVEADGHPAHLLLQVLPQVINYPLRDPGHDDLLGKTKEA